jgi:hypothetical protein
VAAGAALVTILRYAAIRDGAQRATTGSAKTWHHRQ